MKSLFTISLFILSVSMALSAQDSLIIYHIENDIVVTANRTPTAFSDVARTVTVITNKEIELSAAQSVPELLENVIGVDVQQRGSQGIQADISMRGAGFNQTLILLNGLKLTDPQTGHHNMNLPVDLSDIERIEVLKGPGSRLYGPNAFGGVINIITKNNEDFNVSIGGMYGEHNLYNSRLNLSLPVGSVKNRLTFSKFGNDGYIRNSDFQNLTFSQNSRIILNPVAFEISSGYNEKNFGANTFYTTAFPDQYESTILRFLQTGIDIHHADFYAKLQGFYRSHYDNFTLFRKTPSLYTNIHRTSSYGTELQLNYTAAIGVTSFGAEISKEQIDSNNLGSHSRHKGGLFLQQQFNVSAFTFSLGASAYNYSAIGWEAWPGVDVSFRLNENSKIYSSISRGFRVPTYTELYYSGGGIQGNANLKSEKSLNYEAGYAYWDNTFQGEINIFRRDNNNLIDYVQDMMDGLFYAQNFTALTTLGLESAARINNPLKYVNSIYTKYAYLDSDIDLQGKTTRYTLTHFKHQFILGADYTIALLQGLNQSWNIRYEERLTTSKYTLVDTRLSWKNPHVKLFIDISNVFDKKYSDIPTVPAPGRWIKAGFEYNLLDQK